MEEAPELAAPPLVPVGDSRRRQREGLRPVCGRDGILLPRGAALRKGRLEVLASGSASPVLGQYAQEIEDAVEIVVAVILDFNPPAFFVMMQLNVGCEMLLQPVLQML